MEWPASRRTDKRHVPSCGVHRINMEAHELSSIYYRNFFCLLPRVLMGHVVGSVKEGTKVLK